MRIMTDLEGWDRSLPAVLVAPIDTVASRRAALHRFAVAALALPESAVSVEHASGRAPRLRLPEGSSLRLSSASRDGLAAFAIAAGPVGIDVERVDGDGDVPWNVLHPAEVEELRGLSGAARGRRFACVWACKEAYLKAIGTGLGREPAAISVRIGEGGRAFVDDAVAGGAPATLRWAWYHVRAQAWAVAVAAPGSGGEWV